MNRKQPFVERVRDNLIALEKQRPRGWRAELCRRSGMQPASLTRILSERTQPPTLALVEQVAEMESISPLSLMTSGADELTHVNPDESRLLRYLRSWPKTVVTALVAFLEHFGNEAPMDRDLRNGATMLRALSERQRRHVLAHMVMLREGLPRDLEVALRLPAAGSEPRVLGQLQEGTTRQRRRTT